MAIAVPAEPVYYYECSAGHFRLSYFLPFDLLKRLRRENKISKLALEDFPDGADLGCTDADFADFDATYGYRPPLDPSSLQRAFYAIFSTTRGWSTFRGSGFIPAAELERRLGAVDQMLRAEGAMPEDGRVVPDQATLPERRRAVSRRAAATTRTARTLRAMPVDGIDPERALPQQPFRRVRMKKGTSAERIFAQLHQKKGR